MVQALLSGGADVRAEDAQGSTALHAAARRGDVAMIDELFGVGALVDARSRAGETPLGAARARGTRRLFESCRIGRSRDPRSRLRDPLRRLRDPRLQRRGDLFADGFFEAKLKK
jgi:ankyrin repeat protein